MHLPALPLRVLLAACVAAVLGCTIWDGRSTLRFEPDGLLSAASLLRVRVASSGDVDEVELVLDGDPLPGRYATNADLELGVLQVAEGDHVLQARELGGAHAVESAERTVRIDRTGPRVFFVPEWGLDPRTTPFTATARFDEPIAPASLRVTARVGGAVGGPIETIPVTATPSRDGREATLSLAKSTGDYGGVELRLEATDVLGNPAVEGTVASWSPPIFDGAVSASPLRTNAVVTVTVTSPERPPRVELWAGDVLVDAQEGLASPWSLQWDTSHVASGTYPLTVRAPGWATRMWQNPVRVAVDHEAPVLGSCLSSPRPTGSYPPPPRAAYLARHDCVAMAFDEPVQSDGASVTVRAGTTIVPASITYGQTVTACPGASFLPWPSPAQLTVELSAGARDAFGNATSAPISCTLPVPSWLAYWDGPAADAGEAITATELSIDFASYAYVPVRLLWIAPSAAGTGALLRRADAWLGDTFAPVGEPLNVVAGSSATRMQQELAEDVAWIERSPGAPGLVRCARYGNAWTDPFGGPLNRDPSRDATALAQDPLDSGRALAWIEATDGAPVIEAIEWSAEATRQPTLRASAGTDPVALAFLAGLVRVPSGGATYQLLHGPLVAWVERAADGSTALRTAAQNAGAWTAVGGDLAARPGGTVSDPVLYAPAYDSRLVAWIEDGAVWARRYTSGDAVAWRAPERVGGGGAARALRLANTDAGLVLAWVERDPAGDRVDVRRLAADGSWTALASPNAGEEAPITAFDLGDGGEQFPVAWADADGHVTVRLYNGP